MLVSYFDESGTTDRDPAVIVAGVVADSKYWSELEAPWTDKLAEFHLTQYHAVDCENRQNEFLSYERCIRDALTGFFSRLLGKVPGLAFGSAIRRADWHSHAPDELKARCSHDPYYMAFELALQQVSEWSKEYADGEPVALVFSNQQEYSEIALQIYRRYAKAGSVWPGIGGLIFQDPRLIVPLQAADLVAYELHRNLKNPAITRPMWDAIEAGPGMMGVSLMVHDAESLANAMNGPRRYWRPDDTYP